MKWGKIMLGDILKNRDNRYKPNDKSISDLKRIEKIDFSGNIYLSDKSSNTDMIIVKKGDLVISGINVEKGAMSVYQGNEDVVATIHYSSYSFDDKKIDIDFLKMFLKSPEFKNSIKEQVPGGIKTEIKAKHILPLQIIIPLKVEDQKKVVKKFLGLETKNQEIKVEIKKQNELINQLRQSFLREAMQGKLVKQDPKDGHAKDLLAKIKEEKAKLGKKEKELPPIKPEEIPFEIPENWVWCRLGEIANKIEYGTSEKADSNSSNIPILRMNNIQSGKLDYSDLKYVKPTIKDLPKLFLKKHDLLFNRTNSWELVGKSGVYNQESDEMTFASYLIRVQFDKCISSDYINAYINSSLCRETQIEPELFSKTVRQILMEQN